MSKETKNNNTQACRLNFATQKKTQATQAPRWEEEQPRAERSEEGFTVLLGEKQRRESREEEQEKGKKNIQPHKKHDKGENTECECEGVGVAVYIANLRVHSVAVSVYLARSVRYT